MTDQVSPADSSAGGSSNTPPSNDSGAPSPKNNISLQSSIKQFVGMTNSALATFEEAADGPSTALVSRLQQIGKQGRYVVTRAMATYEHRGQYGPQIVAGSAATVGAIVALRRGKITGTLAGGLTGAAAYGNIYGYNDYSATSWRNSVPKKEE